MLIFFNLLEEIEHCIFSSWSAWCLPIRHLPFSWSVKAARPGKFKKEHKYFCFLFDFCLLWSCRCLSRDWRGQLCPRHSYTGPFKYAQATFHGEGPNISKTFRNFQLSNILEIKDSFKYHIFFIIKQTLVKFTIFLTNCFDFSGDNNKKTEGAYVVHIRIVAANLHHIFFTLVFFLS